MNIDELLAEARLPEKEIQVCLRGDLLAEYDAAAAALDEAERMARIEASLDSGGPKIAAAERVAAVRERLLAASVTFRLRAVPRSRWTQLYAEHPPRDGDAIDAATGFNRETFFDALTLESVIDPVMAAEQWQALADRLSSAQYDALTTAAWEVNRSGVDVPFSLAASRALTRSEPASERPEPSASAPSGSTAGNPPPSTSTTSKGSSSRPARKPSGTKSSKR